MNHKRKIAIALVFGVLLLWGIGYFWRLPFLGVSPWEAMPRHSGMLLKVKKSTLDRFDPKKQGNETARIFLPEAVQRDLEQFQKLFDKKITLPEDGQVYISINPNRTTGIDVLFVLDSFRSVNVEAMFALESSWQWRQSIFRNHTVFSVKAGDQRFALAKYRNLLLAARHPYLVENAISQLKSPASSLCRDASFTKLVKKLEEEEATLNVLLNFSQFGSQFSPLIQASKIGQVEGLGNVAGWLLLRLPTTPITGVWSGAFTPAPGSVLMASNFRAGEIPFKNVFRAMPDNLAAFAWLTLSNYAPSSDQHRLWKHFFQKWFGGEIALALGEPIESESPELFLLLQSTDAKLAESQLQAYAARAGALDSYDYQMFKVMQCMGTEVGEMAGIGASFTNPFATVLGEYVLFSNTKAGLERWIDKYLAGQTFSKNFRFLQSLRPLPTEASGFLYLESEKSWQQLVGFLDAKLEASVRGNPLRFNHLAATWHRSGSLFELSMVAPPGAAKAEQQPANILWRAPLAGVCALPPFVFKDSKSGEALVFTQDDGNRIYLISRSGRVLWRRALEEPIQSGIFHIDLDNNSESQLVFSTAGKIYVIDVNGADVSGYPLELQVPATNGVTVIDFFKSKDYQFFIACENGKAYGFDEKGSPVEGWRPHEDVGTVRHAIVHFQEGGKDYLVLLNEEGTLQVYQKNGEFRFSQKKFGSFFAQAPDFQAAGNAGRIVACDTTGKVYVTNLAGDDFRLNLAAGGAKNIRFAFADVRGDERKDYLALGGRNLSIYGYEGSGFKKMLDHVFRYPQDDIFPLDWGGSRQKYIGAVSSDKKQILMLDGNGRLLPQFPLAGNTPFVIEDLLDDRKPVLVVGLDDSIYAYSFE
jgi:hypothetical protein